MKRLIFRIFLWKSGKTQPPKGGKCCFRVVMGQGRADTQTTHHATFSTVPTHQLLLHFVTVMEYVDTYNGVKYVPIRVVRDLERHWVSGG